MKKLFAYLALFCNGIFRYSQSKRNSGATACGDQGYPKFTYDDLWNLEVAFWEKFKYPANAEEAKSVNSTLFADNVQGRVDITRDFPGRELNTEYLFGLFTDPTAVALLNIPVSYEIVQFAANDYIAAATTVVMFNSTLFDTTVPVTIDTFISWNHKREIVQYDATFRWFGFLLDWLIDAAVQKLGLSNRADAVAALVRTLGNGICQIHDKYCTGDNQQYKDADECFNFLTNTIRFGQDYELGRNTLLCRSVHQQMVQYRPAVHCPHIGKTGGGMCVDDQSYVEKVTEKYFTNQPFVVRPSHN